MDDVIAVVKQILSKKIDISNIKETDDFSKLGLDSLDLVELMIEIEDTIGVEFTSDEISELKTIHDVLELIEIKLN